MATTGRYRLGVDIGGTFTDGVLFDTETGELTLAKLLTTAKDPAVGARDTVRDLLVKGEISAHDLFVIIHGTTLVANTLIQRRGSKTGLITTAGFRDVLEMGREIRYDVYNLTATFPAPLVPRPWRKEVSERVLADGTVYTPIDLEGARQAARELVNEGVEAIAVCFLHSYRNPAHERAVGDMIAKEFPDLPYSLSSEVVAEFREYERSSTTVANAYVQPLMAQYLGGLEGALRGDGYGHKLYVMLSSGGITTVDTAAQFPVRLVESGPAAGALAAAYFGKLIDERRIVSFDMGGTTAKACLVDDAKPTRTKAFEVARVHRFMKGSGLPVRSPVIDMIEVGAGGGSIASIDELGLLKVGPQSAGSEPGPACYGLGGTEPTVTDANLVLGYLDPQFFAGGSVALDAERAKAALGKLNAALGTDVIGSAWGVHEVVGENMAQAVRIHLAEKGRDPRRYTLFSFGGGGPLHASHVAKKLRIGRILCPMAAGVLSAFGFLVAPAAFDFIRTYITRLDNLDWNELNGIYTEMASRGRAVLEEAGVAAPAMEFVRTADMRYVGQMHEITVPVPGGTLTPDSRKAMEEYFHETYEALYGSFTADDPIEALNWRLLATGPEPQITLHVNGAGGSGATTKGTRPVYFPGKGFVETTVYDRYALPIGFRADGPAVVEERESTAIVYPGDRFHIDKYKNLIIELPEAGA
ncbi:MAG: hydantoinase/oxoprolinase family protein [Armatimonadetes bacterium]|nr:hydantoinase/oxoprolinase family protein [Armatimonadota bacterium]